MITWIAGWPHNGSTFLRQILKDCFELKTYSVYPEKQFEYLFGDEVVSFSKELIESVQARLEYFHSATEMYFIKVHELPENDNSPVIFVIRDGRDAVTAFSHFFHLPIRYGIVGHGTRWGSWSNYFYAWDPKNRPKTLIVRFEDMVKRPNWVAGDIDNGIGEFFGLIQKHPYVDDFEENKKKWPGLFHDRTDCWKERMSADDLVLFKKCHGDLNRELGYE